MGEIREVSPPKGRSSKVDFEPKPVPILQKTIIYDHQPEKPSSFEGLCFRLRAISDDERVHYKDGRTNGTQ